MVCHKFEDWEEEFPQGGSQSPIPSNILLNELDRELERRGHPCVRYTQMTVLSWSKTVVQPNVSVTVTSSFVEKKLFLNVSKDKNRAR